MSETMARVAAVSEAVPRVLLDRGGSDSPGALDAKVRY